MSQELHSLNQLLDRLEEAADGKDEVSLGAVMEQIGDRSFGPVLLLAGVVTLAPVISGIPGVPVLMGTLVFLTAIQLLFGRDHYWLPQWMRRRSVEHRNLCKAIGWVRRPARFVDRLFKARLTVFTQGVATYFIAVAATAVAMLTPAMELVPFSANGAGISLSAFGLALITRDGVVALLAFLTTLATYGVVLTLLL